MEMSSKSRTTGAATPITHFKAGHVEQRTVGQGTIARRTLLQVVYRALLSWIIYHSQYLSAQATKKAAVIASPIAMIPIRSRSVRPV